MTYSELFNTLFNNIVDDIVTSTGEYKAKASEYKATANEYKAKAEEKVNNVKSSIDEYIDKMKDKYGDEQIPYSEQIDPNVLINVNKLVDAYYDKEYKDKLSFIKSDFIESELKKNYREFLSWVFTQL